MRASSLLGELSAPHAAGSSARHQAGREPPQRRKNRLLPDVLLGVAVEGVRSIFGDMHPDGRGGIPRTHGLLDELVTAIASEVARAVTPALRPALPCVQLLATTSG